MADHAFFTIRMVSAEGRPAVEPDCTVAFRRTDGSGLAPARHVVFPPERRFALPAFPTERTLYCEITPSLYQPIKSKFFTPDAARAQEQEIIAVRSCDKWKPTFVAMAALPAPRFQGLTSVIGNSTEADVKHGRELGRLENVYDGLSAEPEQLAKMALLNLYAVTSDTREPISNRAWFSFVQQIVRIDRERFVAEVDTVLFDNVQTILARIGEFARQGFFTEPPSLHYDNIPPRYSLTADLITVKVRYNQGNLQFTLGKARCGNRDVVLLDCDMDEHSNVIEHAGDLFLHVFTGGTHPIDMHEYIVHEDPGVVLGYALAPAVGERTYAAAV